MVSSLRKNHCAMSYVSEEKWEKARLFFHPAGNVPTFPQGRFGLKAYPLSGESSRGDYMMVVLLVS